jgi:hypothetical protein
MGIPSNGVVDGVGGGVGSEGGDGGRMQCTASVRSGAGDGGGDCDQEAGSCNGDNMFWM